MYARIKYYRYSMTENITQKLSDWTNGDSASLAEIEQVVMNELKRQARHYMNREASDHTLQATALVNEAFIRLVDVNVSWQNRAHFFAVAAKLMRRILVDHARQKKSLKRGGRAHHTSMDDALVINNDNVENLVMIDRLLKEFADFDDRAVKLFELHFFAGMAVDEIAEVEGVSESTVARELRLAKAWLTKRLQAV
jgi:RNA polymerase sigma-70 factor (ECF subfamily)